MNDRGESGRGLGLAGGLTRAFIASPLTPLLILAALAVGLIALVSLPREEEPQISVPMVDVMVAAPGLRAPDAVELVTEPLETIIRSIENVEHVYSQTEDDQVMVTARFDVGTDADDAILRVHERINANLDRIPHGIDPPLIVGRGIDGVAIVALTLSPAPEVAEHWDDNGLYNIAEELRAALMSVEDVGLTYITGGRADQIRVEPDPERLSQYGVTLQQLAGRIAEANRAFPAGQVTTNDETRFVTAGQTLQGMPDIGLLLLTTRDGRPVYVRDVADVIVGAEPADARAWMFTREESAGSDGEDAHGSTAGWQRTPAVTLALAFITFLVTNFSANGGYWKHIFMPPVPVWLWPILVPVEIVGVLSKPFSLMIRLFANITAGHIIILSLTSLIFLFETLAVAPVSVLFVLFMNFIELLVAALQAYIFTLLTALFIGLASPAEHH